MKKRIITIKVISVNEPYGGVWDDTEVERERDAGASFNKRIYEWVRDSSFKRCQRAQLTLRERAIADWEAQ